MHSRPDWFLRPGVWSGPREGESLPRGEGAAARASGLGGAGRPPDLDAASVGTGPTGIGLALAGWRALRISSDTVVGVVRRTLGDAITGDRRCETVTGRAGRM
jgi:hypothetical protein